VPVLRLVMWSSSSAQVSHNSLSSASFCLAAKVIAGPVGLMSVYSAFLRGASKVYSVDRVPRGLAKARELGAIPIDSPTVIQSLKSSSSSLRELTELVTVLGMSVLTLKGSTWVILLLSKLSTSLETEAGLV
jgi:Zn-dependent alcohol dehydrogenase